MNFKQNKMLLSKSTQVLKLKSNQTQYLHAYEYVSYTIQNIIDI